MAQDLLLPDRELVELRVDRAPELGGEGVEHEAGQAGREHRVPVGHLPHRLHQLGPGDGLGDVAPGAGPDDADDVLGRVRHRQGEELHLRVGPRHRVDHRPTAAAGHVDVEQHHVRSALADHLDGRVPL